ncbi:hypothetical protein [Sporomusa aerivorans]|uniref:hypothetical protein n=1 Tax=Sporomusa aerivorans TaxID=204936 RepID=UPI00352B825F
MRYVSATELAKLAKCERQLYLNSLYGEKTGLTERYIKRGNLEHEAFRRLLTGKSDNWFIKFVRWLLKLFFR